MKAKDRAYVTLFGTRIYEVGVPVPGHKEWGGWVKHEGQRQCYIHVRFCNTRSIYCVKIGYGTVIENRKLKMAAGDALRSYISKRHADTVVLAEQVRKAAEESLREAKAQEKRCKAHIHSLENLTP